MREREIERLRMHACVHAHYGLGEDICSVKRDHRVALKGHEQRSSCATEVEQNARHTLSELSSVNGRKMRQVFIDYFYFQ